MDMIERETMRVSQTADPRRLLGVLDAKSPKMCASRLIDTWLRWLRRRRLMSTAACAMLLLATSMVVGAFGVRASTEQDANTKIPTFDVISIKPHALDGQAISMIGLENRPDGVHGSYMTLAMLLRMAYGYKKFSSDNQIIGMPKWGASERFDIDAKMSEGDASAMQKMSEQEQWPLREQMLRAMLRERFNLSLHLESRIDPAYELVVAKGGSKLNTESGPSANGFKDKDGKPLNMSYARFLKDKTVVQGYSMADFALFLSGASSGLERPVLDRTGLTGKYNFELSWTPPRKLGDTASMEDTANLFTILQDELGLKLESAKEPVEVIVIDHVERPSAN
jgi:uncharacterized protein (TIGR03435 family)